VADKRYAVVLSDVHIGNDTRTCWYQRAAHEPRLTEALAWIVARKHCIREVLLLGDLFDVWTYPPSMRPPTMQQIIDANPTMLGPRGPLAAVVRALPGQVRLLLGNHDGSLTRADIDRLNHSLGGDASRGERIALLGAPWRVVTGARGARTVFAHGHHWCMFNAPDSRSRWATIPIGHFVSRAIAYQLANSPGSDTAADRRNSANPNGIDLGAALASWNRSEDLAGFLIRYICNSTKLPLTERVVMPGGATTTPAEAARVFDGLFTLWLRREGRLMDALRAATADWKGEDLAWFAQRLAMRTGSDLTVMGHTHSAIGGLDVSPVDYVNSGYECVSRPDARSTPFTFTRVDLDRPRGQVLAVADAGGGRFTVAPARVRRLPSVVLRGLDYSCYARIVNRSDRPLRLVRDGKDSTSHWVVRPPSRIPPHSRLDLWLQDAIGPFGSSCSFTYSDGTRNYDFALSCPFSGAPNGVSSSVPYRTRTGSTTGWRTGGVDWLGHPVQAQFFVGSLLPAPALPSGSSSPATRPGPAPPKAAPKRPPRVPARRREPRDVVLARAVLDRAATPPERGLVLCIARLESYDGTPLLDPTVRGGRLANPPRHLLSPDVQTIALPDGTSYRYVWVQPNVAPSSPPLAGGIAVLPDPGQRELTVIAFNVAGLTADHRRGCTNAHHAEQQLVGFVDAQPVQWRMRLAKLGLHNYSRKGPDWGYSACNACLHDLAAFLTALNRLTRPSPVRAGISWERLYDKNAICGHPTDAANVDRLVRAGWDHPQGPMPTVRPRVLTP
jgi:UDP-2,3-diacylglucosamine pyrophosphatase LpxH